MKKQFATEVYYLTESYHNIFHALQRFFYFVLNKELTKYSEEKKHDHNNLLLLVISEEKENPHLLKLLSHYPNIKSVILGFDDNSLINLVDTSSLKTKFTALLKSELDINQPLFSRKELIDKVRLFLKDHGDKSLFDRLNDVRYRILNGVKLYLTGELNLENARKEFLIPGIESWNRFQTRFEKYSPYLILLGHKTEQHEIKTLTESYNGFINLLKSSLERDSLDIKIETLNKNIELVKKIDEILTGISMNLEDSHARLQNSGS